MCGRQEVHSNLHILYQMIAARNKNRSFKWITNDRGGKSPLHIDYFNPPAQSRVRKAVYPGLCSGGVFDISKNGESVTSPGNLCQCSVTLTVPKGFFLHLNGIFCTSDGVHCLILSLGSIKNMTVFFTPSHQEFIHISKIFLELFLQYERCSNLLIPSVILHWTLEFSRHPCTGELRSGRSAADGLLQCWVEVEIALSSSREADRMHKISGNSQSSRKETKMVLAFSVASSQKFPCILNTHKVLRNLEGCGAWECETVFSRDRKKFPVPLQAAA